MMGSTDLLERVFSGFESVPKKKLYWGRTRIIRALGSERISENVSCKTENENSNEKTMACSANTFLINRP